MIVFGSPVTSTIEIFYTVIYCDFFVREDASTTLFATNSIYIINKVLLCSTLIYTTRFKEHNIYIYLYDNIKRTYVRI